MASCDGCSHYRENNQTCIIKPYLKRKPYRCKTYKAVWRDMNSERTEWGV